LNATHQFLVYANDVNMLGESTHTHTHTHTIKKNTEALLVTSKENGLEVNAKKTKHMFIS
jgi:hypothetical protein